MANIRDIRRRIRSVKNTRQITKAMKMVAAAKLRRAQERALAARPYAQMMINVLHSLVSRADLVDPKTGEPQTSAAGATSGAEHPAGAGHRRPRTGGRLQLERAEGGGKVPRLFQGQEHQHRGRRPQRPRLHAPSLSRGNPGQRERAGQVQVVGEHLNLLGKLEYEAVSEIVERVIQAYDRAEIDSVYVIYNEFKSVISQRLIAQRILPVQEIGRREVALTEEFSLEERERMGEAARTAGISLKEPEETEAEIRAKGFPAPMWTTSTSSRRRKSSRLLPRTSSCSSSRRCWSRWPPNTLPA